MLKNISYILLLSLIYQMVNSVPVLRESNDNDESSGQFNSSDVNPMFNPNLFEGDIVNIDIPDDEFRGLAQLPNGWMTKWDKGIVPYKLSPEFTSAHLATIKADLKMIEDNTANRTVKCVRFVPQTNETDYVLIVNKPGCNSAVGKTGGVQEISLNIESRCVVPGIVAHEFIHALGFLHEQSRPDRDNYIDIKYDNIIEQFQFAFDKQTYLTDTLGFPYDYESIMHYGPKAFSKNDQFTIIPKKKGVILMEAYERKKLSKFDIAQIRKYYNCV